MRLTPKEIDEAVKESPQLIQDVLESKCSYSRIEGCNKDNVKSYYTSSLKNREKACLCLCTYHKKKFCDSYLKSDHSIIIEELTIQDIFYIKMNY